MLWNILKFEFYYQFKTITNYVMIFIAFVFPVILFYFLMELFPNALYYYNSPGFFSNFYYLLFLLMSLSTIAITGNCFQRDLEHGTEELFYSMPVKKWEFAFGRFMGSLLFSQIVFICIFIASFSIYLYPKSYSEKIGPFHLAYHLVPFLNICILNSILYGILTFAADSFFKDQAIISMVGIIFLLVTFLVERLVNNVELSPFLTLLDPSGYSAANFDMKYWTPVDQNLRWLPLENYYLYNRLLWTFISILIGIIAYKRFSFKKQKNLSIFNFVKFKKTNEVNPGNVTSSIQYPGAMNSSKRIQFWMISKSYLIQIVKDINFLVFFGITVIVMGFLLYRVDKYDTYHVHALSYIVAESVDVGLIFIIYLVVAIYPGELIHWERKIHADGIMDTLNIHPSMIYYAKQFTLLLIIIISIILGIVSGIITQAIKGNYNIDILSYINILFNFKIGYYAYMILMIFFGHSFINNKKVSYSFFGMAFILFILAVTKFNIFDYLIIPILPAITNYSEMNGFGHYINRYIAITGYWLSISCLLSIVGYLFYQRGYDVSFKTRFINAINNLTKNVKILAFVFLSISIILGSFIYYNTRILNKMMLSPNEILENIVEYEKKYKGYEKLSQPKIISIYSEGDLYPEKREIYLKSNMTLKNKSAEEISEIMIQYYDEIEFKNFVISKSGKWTLTDDKHKIKIYKFDTPLQIREEMNISFESYFNRKGFPMIKTFDNLAENGTFLSMEMLLIKIGYDPEKEISDSFYRKKYGLPERPRDPPIDDRAAQKISLFRRDADFVKMKFKLSTSSDQIIIAPGKVVKSWKENNRNYYIYEPEVETDLFASIVSARYEVQRDKWNDVELEIYYHKAHTYNVSRMMEAMKDSLAFYTKELGPYPHSYLRILEFPRYSAFAQSFPGTIPFSEELGFIQKMKKGDFDQIYFVTAHEIAHQWWGYQIMPSSVEGSNALSESMAEYYALLVAEKKYGKENIGRFTKFDMDSYLKSRSGGDESEKPWYRTNNRHGRILYQKGGIILYGLRWLIGHEKMSNGIKSFFDKYKNVTDPYPTTLSLIGELENVTKEKYLYYIEDAFKNVTVYDNKIKSASMTVDKDGNYLVTAKLEFNKFRYDKKGGESVQPIQSEVFEIGLLPEIDSETNLEIPFLIKRKRFSSGEVEVKLISKTKPVYISLDPYHILIDRDLGNNKKKL